MSDLCLLWASRPVQLVHQTICLENLLIENRKQISIFITSKELVWPCPDVATAFPTSSASRPSLKFSPSGLWKFDLTIIDGQWSYLWYKSLTEIWRWVVDWKETCLWCSNVSWSPFLLPLQDPQCHSSTPGKGISKKWKWCDGESQCDAQ